MENRGLELSPQLCAFLEVPEGTRMFIVEAVKKVGDYIIENRLLDTSSPTIFKFDDKMTRTFGNESQVQERIMSKLNPEIYTGDILKQFEYFVAILVTEHVHR